MIELIEKAEKYAAEKTSEVITNAIAKAYADGYRDGYKDRANGIFVYLHDNKTEYVDLGLPSGTLWAADYEKDDDKNIYLPFCMTHELSIPTKEQWDELRNNCKWQFKDIIQRYNNHSEVICLGPNGNKLKFDVIRLKDFLDNKEKNNVIFWLKQVSEDTIDKLCANMCQRKDENNELEDYIGTDRFFSGFKLPIRLVQ